MVGDRAAVHSDGFFGGVLEVAVAVPAGGDRLVHRVADPIDFRGTDGGPLIQLDVGAGVINRGKYIRRSPHLKVYQWHEITNVAQQFEAEIGRGSGLAAQGLAEVCAALRDGDVDTLIVGELGEATVVTGKARTTVARDADMLSELGEPVDRVARADEALPFAAIAVGAALVRDDNRIAPLDGVGALLRYAATNRLGSHRS